MRRPLLRPRFRQTVPAMRIAARKATLGDASDEESHTLPP